MDSLWAAEVELPSFPALEGDLKTDVLIVGGGMAGLLCAYRLSQAGVDCALIEVDELCHGVSRNTTAKITAQHGLIYERLLRTFGAEAARMYFEANQRAVIAYRELCSRIDCDFESRDALLYATVSIGALEREFSALASLNAPVDFVSRPALPFAVQGAVRLRDQAQFHPLKFAAAIAKGLPIYEHTAAKSMEGTTVRTDRGSIRASRVIIATHFPLLNKHGSYFLKMYQDRSYVLALEDAADVQGMYLGVDGEQLSFRNHGRMLLVGGGAHRTGKPSDGWKPLECFHQTYYPKAVCRHRWAAQDCITLDGLPYIGPYSKRTPNLFVATGFQKWGMTSSMVAAQLLCDLVQGKPNPYAALFSPSRSMLHPQLFVNMAESTLHLLKPTRPRCPHLGCALTWNPHEHSWDCPCHGSRFAKDGALMDNPATGPLKK